MSYPLISTHPCAYQGIWNIHFLESLACFVFFVTPVLRFAFCLFTDELEVVIFKKLETVGCGTNRIDNIWWGRFRTVSNKKKLSIISNQISVRNAFSSDLRTLKIKSLCSLCVGVKIYFRIDSVRKKQIALGSRLFYGKGNTF